ncbi:tight adherence protein C [Abditibacterium utsteinense]|uniref:Tight adherence protein C n=1 Tax=Abditibacterium utsteinense TaxID=1960156 RepID=A0A2S8SVS3_9BACT|nr:type II secretion system F family protein [Abditibacterium utsteinense]PQV64891.1 tight adherence protein C [Abditibacterium utsteinense]
MQSLVTPLIIFIWLGFLACLGVLLSARFARVGFQKRLQQALSPDEDEVDELLQEKQNEEMEKSFLSRTLGPITQKLGRNFRTQAKGASGAQVRDMLEQAGHPLGMHYPEFMGLKMFCLIAFTGIGILSSFIMVPLILNFAGMAGDAQSTLMMQGLWILCGAYAGFSGPMFWLRKFVNKRVKQIRKSMADVVDLIVLAIEAGLGFDQAVGEAVAKTKGPLSEELGRVLDEIRVGKPQGEAFRDMSKRVRMSELTLLVAAIDQATRMGTGLASALRLQATEIREKRMAYIREQAGKLPVKMMLPLVFCIFPALFVVILGPAGVKMVEMSASGELNM